MKVLLTTLLVSLVLVRGCNCFSLDTMDDEEIKGTVSSLLQSVSNLKMSHRLLVNEHDQLIAENTGLLDANRKLQGDHADLKKLFHDKAKDMEGRIKEKETQQANTAVKLKKMERENRKMKEIIEKMTLDAKFKETHVEKIVGEVKHQVRQMEANHRASMATMENTYKKREEEVLAIARNIRSEVEKENNSIRKEYEKLQRKYTKMVTEKNDMKRSLTNSLTRCHHERKQTEQRKQQEITRLNQETGKLTVENENLQRNVTQILAEKTEKENHYRKHLQDCVKERVNLQQETYKEVHQLERKTELLVADITALKMNITKTAREKEQAENYYIKAINTLQQQEQKNKNKIVRWRQQMAAMMHGLNGIMAEENHVEFTKENNTVGKDDEQLLGGYAAEKEKSKSITEETKNTYENESKSLEAVKRGAKHKRNTSTAAAAYTTEGMEEEIFGSEENDEDGKEIITEPEISEKEKTPNKDVPQVTALIQYRMEEDEQETEDLAYSDEEIEEIIAEPDESQEGKASTEQDSAMEEQTEVTSAEKEDVDKEIDEIEKNIEEIEDGLKDTQKELVEILVELEKSEE